MMTQRRKNPGPRFSGPDVDALTGLNPNTRRAGEARGVLKPDADGYDFEQLQRAAAWAEVARLGIQSKGTRDYLIRALVEEMRKQADSVPEEPRYLVLCATPKPEQGYDLKSWPPPVVKRMMQDGGAQGLADGNGAVCIAQGLSPEDLRLHFEWAAKIGADEVATAVFDTTGLLKRLLRKVEERRRLEAARP